MWIFFKGTYKEKNNFKGTYKEKNNFKKGVKKSKTE